MNIAAAGRPASIAAAVIGLPGPPAMVGVASVFADVVNMTLAAAPATVAVAAAPMPVIAAVHIGTMLDPAQATLPQAPVATEPVASSVLLVPKPLMQATAPTRETRSDGAVPVPDTPIEDTMAPLEPAQTLGLAHSEPVEPAEPMQLPVTASASIAPGKGSHVAGPTAALPRTETTPVTQVATAGTAPQQPQTAELPSVVREVRTARPFKAADDETSEVEPLLEAAAPAAVTPPLDLRPVAAPSTAVILAAADDRDIAADDVAVTRERAKTADFGGANAGPAVKSAAPALVDQTLAAPQFSAFVKDLPGATALHTTTAQSANPVAAASVAPSVPVIDASSGQVGYPMGVAIARRITDGGNELLVRLDPPALGRIEVRIAFDDSGSLRAVVAADSPIALDLLRRESGELGRALADAGVRADAQSLRFDSRGGEGGQPRERYYHSGAASPADNPAPGTDEPAYQPLRWQRQLDLLA